MVACAHAVDGGAHLARVHREQHVAVLGGAVELTLEVVRRRAVAQGARRLARHGGAVLREIVRFEDAYRLCYLRGPGGIIVGLAEELG
mgnify:CR=1 FL=1